MVEITPATPFAGLLDFDEIWRHSCDVLNKLSDQATDKSKLLMGMSIVPHIGTSSYYVKSDGNTVPMEARAKLNPYSQSETFLDETLTDHPRFKTCTETVVLRRGKKPEIKIPLYKDVNTTLSEVVLDHYGYGMGAASLQITFSSMNMDECRFLYDQMHVIGSFAQALSNNSVVVNGKLMNWDSRWKILEQAADDRKSTELESIKKSRYGPASFYISNDPRNKNIYNDSKYALNKRFRRSLKKHLKSRNSQFYRDTRLLNHYGHLFIREALTIFEQRTNENNLDDTIDFELIKGTNYNNVRFKPPGGFDSTLGWLFEFRSMDVPITSREKAAMVFL